MSVTGSIQSSLGVRRLFLNEGVRLEEALLGCKVRVRAKDGEFGWGQS